MTKRRLVSQCQRRLLSLWGGMGALTLVIVLIQIAPGGAYASHSAAVLDWFLPTVIPTVSLMVGTVVADLRAPDPGATLDEFTYRLVLSISLLYLGLVITFLLMYAQSRTPIDDLQASGRIVTAVYSVVGIALGALFVTKKSGE